MDFAVDIQLAHSAGNKLCYLGSEIENENRLMHSAKLQQPALLVWVYGKVVKKFTDPGAEMEQMDATSSHVGTFAR